MKDTLVFVLLGERKDRRGKVDKDHFFPLFAREATAKGLSVCVKKPAAISPKLLARAAALVLIYNEEKFCSTDLSDSRNIKNDWRLLEKRLSNSEFKGLLLHSLNIGELLGEKASTNQHYATARIPVPAMVEKPTQTPVFSNANSGSGKDVAVLQDSSLLDSSRYNTQYINTEFEQDGKRYYVCLRAFAVGKELISVYVRARDVQDDTAAVHASNTPLDPALINRIYEEWVTPQIRNLESICARAGSVLGLGFYVHDMLPCRETGELYVCESGLKLGNGLYRKRLTPIAKQMPDQKLFSAEEAQEAASAFLRQLGEQEPLDFRQPKNFGYKIDNALARIRFRVRG